MIDKDLEDLLKRTKERRAMLMKRMENEVELHKEVEGKVNVAKKTVSFELKEDVEGKKYNNNVVTMGDNNNCNNVGYTSEKNNHNIVENTNMKDNVENSFDKLNYVENVEIKLYKNCNKVEASNKENHYIQPKFSRNKASKNTELSSKFSNLNMDNCSTTKPVIHNNISTITSIKRNTTTTISHNNNNKNDNNTNNNGDFSSTNKRFATTNSTMKHSISKHLATSHTKPHFNTTSTLNTSKQHSTNFASHVSKQPTTTMQQTPTTNCNIKQSTTTNCNIKPSTPTTTLHTIKQAINHRKIISSNIHDKMMMLVSQGININNNKNINNSINNNNDKTNTNSSNIKLIDNNNVSNTNSLVDNQMNNKHNNNNEFISHSTIPTPPPLTTNNNNINNNFNNCPRPFSKQLISKTFLPISKVNTDNNNIRYDKLNNNNNNATNNNKYNTNNKNNNDETDTSIISETEGLTKNFQQNLAAMGYSVVNGNRMSFKLPNNDEEEEKEEGNNNNKYNLNSKTDTISRKNSNNNINDDIINSNDYRGILRRGASNGPITSTPLISNQHEAREDNQDVDVRFTSSGDISNAINKNNNNNNSNIRNTAPIVRNIKFTTSPRKSTATTIITSSSSSSSSATAIITPSSFSSSLSSRASFVQVSPLTTTKKIQTKFNPHDDVTIIRKKIVSISDSDVVNNKDQSKRKSNIKYNNKNNKYGENIIDNDDDDDDDDEGCSYDDDDMDNNISDDNNVTIKNNIGYDNDDDNNKNDKTSKSKKGILKNKGFNYSSTDVINMSANRNKKITRTNTKGNKNNKINKKSNEGKGDESNDMMKRKKKVKNMNNKKNNINDSIVDGEMEGRNKDDVRKKMVWDGDDGDDNDKTIVNSYGDDDSEDKKRKSTKKNKSSNNKKNDNNRIKNNNENKNKNNNDGDDDDSFEGTSLETYFSVNDFKNYKLKVDNVNNNKNNKNNNTANNNKNNNTANRKVKNRNDGVNNNNNNNIVDNKKSNNISKKYNASIDKTDTSNNSNIIKKKNNKSNNRNNKINENPYLLMTGNRGSTDTETSSDQSHYVISQDHYQDKGKLSKRNLSMRKAIQSIQEIVDSNDDDDLYGSYDNDYGSNGNSDNYGCNSDNNGDYDNDGGGYDDDGGGDYDDDHANDTYDDINNYNGSGDDDAGYKGIKNPKIYPKSPKSPLSKNLGISKTLQPGFGQKASKKSSKNSYPLSNPSKTPPNDRSHSSTKSHSRNHQTKPSHCTTTPSNIKMVGTVSIDRSVLQPNSYRRLAEASLSGVKIRPSSRQVRRGIELFLARRNVPLRSKVDPKVPSRPACLKIQGLMELLKQETIYQSQASKALMVCLSNQSYYTEQSIECHRLLLISSKKKHLIERRLKSLREGHDDDPDCEPQGMRKLVLTDVKLPLKPEFIAGIRNTPGTGRTYFLVTMEYGENMVCSQTVSTTQPLTLGALCLNSDLVLPLPGHEVKVYLEVHALSVPSHGKHNFTMKSYAIRKAKENQKKMRMKKTMMAGRDGYSSSSSTEHFGSTRSLYSSNKNFGSTNSINNNKNSNFGGSCHVLNDHSSDTIGSYDGVDNDILASEFLVGGRMVVDGGCLDKKRFALQGVTYQSPLQGVIHMDVSISQEDVLLRGFMTVRSGDDDAKRRYCCLDHRFLTIYKHNNHQLTKDPIESIDLLRCINVDFTPVCTNYSMQPDSFSVSSLPAIKGRAKLHDSSVFSHWFTSDSSADCVAWCQMLTTVVHDLRKWHPYSIPSVPFKPSAISPFDYSSAL